MTNDFCSAYGPQFIKDMSAGQLTSLRVMFEHLEAAQPKLLEELSKPLDLIREC